MLDCVEKEYYKDKGVFSIEVEADTITWTGNWGDSLSSDYKYIRLRVVNDPGAPSMTIGIPDSDSTFKQFKIYY